MLGLAKGNGYVALASLAAMSLSMTASACTYASTAAVAHGSTLNVSRAPVMVSPGASTTLQKAHGVREQDLHLRIG